MKTKFKNLLLNKKFLSLITTSLVYASFATIFSSNISSQDRNEIEKTNSNLNASTTAAVTENITGFSEYDLLASTNLVAPVITTYGVVGWTNSHKTLTLTTFDGVLVWKLTFANNSEITTFYKTAYPTQSMSDIKVNNYVYLSSENILVMLLGADQYKNQVAVGVNMSTGTLFNPIASKDGSINYIVKVKDGINRLFVNSSNNIIGIKDGKYNDYVSAEYLTFSKAKGVSQLPISIPRNLAKNQNDSLYSYATGVNGINFVTFISNTSSATPPVTRAAAAGSVYRTFYTVAVNDFMNPIEKTAGTSVTLDVGNATNISNPSADINNNDFWKYPTQYLSNTAQEIKFFLVLGGGKSSVVTLNYNINNKTITKEKNLDVVEGEQAFGMYLYNSSTKRLFISNKKSKTHLATGYVNLNVNASASLQFVNLEFSTSNWDTNTFVYSDLIREFPIMSTSQLSYPDPYIVLEKSKTPSAKYFINQSDIQTHNLTFKSYNDPVERFKSQFKNDLQKLPSQVTDANLKSSLQFTGASFSAEIGIIEKSADDQNGVLTFKYSVSYRNWYASSSAYTFHIAATITGFYAKSNFQFSFITGFTGTTSENEKWNKIGELKTNKYAYDVTQDEIINHFITYNIKDSSGSQVTIDKNMIRLSSSTSGYSLTVTVSVSGNFPNGVTRTFTHTYDGFKTISGYDNRFVENPSTFDRSLIYPSELTKTIFLENFVSLGDKWSVNPNDWDFEISSNNLEETATVTLTYTSTTDTSFPNGTNKKIIDNKTIDLFKNIPSQFKDNVSMIEYSGSLTPTQLWTEYQNNPSGSKLLSYLNFPNINNKTNLEITCSNTSSADNDGYLDLNIKIKEGTQTTLFISGDGYFTYDAKATEAFKKILESDTFKVKWTINKANNNFHWIGTNGQVITSQSSTYVVNLENQSYTGINKEMYADQVNEQDIDKLFTFDGYTIINKSVNPNVSQGTLTVIINLKESNSVDSSIGVTQTKTIIINGFKVDTMDSTKYILYAFAGVISITTICLMTFLILFLIKRNKYKTISKVRQIRR